MSFPGSSCHDSSFLVRCKKVTIHPNPPLGESMERCACFPFTCIVRLTVDYVSENQAMLSLRSDSPDGCVFARVQGMGPIDAGGSSQYA